MWRHSPTSVIAVMYQTAAHGDEMVLIHDSALADLCNHDANAGPTVCFLHSDSWLINRLL